MAGAHSLLLFLMARTPGSPAIKEIKPTAAITWKQLGYGPIKKRGREIPLYDCPPDQGLQLGGDGGFDLRPRPRITLCVLKDFTRDFGLKIESYFWTLPMADGVTLLCAEREQRDHRWEWQFWQITPAAINRWAETEWIDLRVNNMARWRTRVVNILSEARNMPGPDFDSSSRWERSMADPATWQLESEINIGEVVGWIFVKSLISTRRYP